MTTWDSASLTDSISSDDDAHGSSHRLKEQKYIMRLIGNSTCFVKRIHSVFTCIIVIIRES